MARGSIIQIPLRAAALLVLAAMYSPVSQLSLSPVYGAIPASIYHQSLMAVAILMGTTGKPVLKRYLPAGTASFIPVLAFSIPTAQFFLFQHSSWLGATHGPWITEAVTVFPLALLSAFCAATLLDRLDFTQRHRAIWVAGSSMASYALLKGGQSFSKSIIRRRIGSGLAFTRSGLQSVLAVLYALLLPSKLIVLAIVPVLHSALFNVHVPLEHTTALLNRTLQANDYTLIARQESLTGYISILDNIQDGFRVMRCDHSLLGGEWLRLPMNAKTGLREPIYAVFVLLEAVRLVQPVERWEEPTLPDSQKNALVMSASQFSLWLC